MFFFFFVRNSLFLCLWLRFIVCVSVSVFFFTICPFVFFLCVCLSLSSLVCPRHKKAGVASATHITFPWCPRDASNYKRNWDYDGGLFLATSPCGPSTSNKNKCETPGSSALLSWLSRQLYPPEVLVSQLWERWLIVLCVTPASFATLTPATHALSHSVLMLMLLGNIRGDKRTVKEREREVKESMLSPPFLEFCRKSKGFAIEKLLQISEASASELPS